MTDTSDDSAKSVSWFEELLDRRVPQVLGLYLGTCWGLIQFVQWLTVRYGLAPHLDHVAFVTSLSLVPSIVILTWFHGRRSQPGYWTRVEKIGIPANLVFTMVLLFLVLQGHEAGAATRTVTLRNEEGQQVERTVPKQEYRRRVLVFGLDNASGDPELDWLEDGLPTALAYDLRQDFFVDAMIAFDDEALQDRLAREGFANGAGMPLALQREVARDLRIEHFASGSFGGEPGRLSARWQLFETATGDAVSEHELIDTDLFTVADEVSRRWKADLGLPKAVIEAAEDLPARELFTSSEEGYELLIRGLRAKSYDHDNEAARRLFEQAIAQDETFAAAYLYRASACVASNDSACALESLEAAMRLNYRFPEVMRFTVKHGYYIYKGDQAKRVALLEMQAEMFPDDPKPRRELGEIHSRNSRWPEAIATYETALEIDPNSAALLLDLGRAHIQNREPEKARQYYEAYAERYPNEADSYHKLGTFYEQVADNESAREQYEKALLLEPGDLVVLLDLGDVENRLGRFDDAEARYLEALAASRQPQDRANVYRHLESQARGRGELMAAVEYMEKRFETLESTASEIEVLFHRLFNNTLYMEAGLEEKARESLRRIEEELAPPFDRVVLVGHLFLLTAAGDMEAAEARLGELDRLIEDMGDRVGGLPALRQQILAQVAEASGDFDTALVHYHKLRQLNPLRNTALVDVLRCQRHLGRSEEARHTLEEMFRVLPHYGEAHHEAGLFYADSGERAKAVEHLRRALEIWARADPGFEAAQEARAKLAELESA